LELASNLFLDDLHTIIQTAFGWWDYHLHQFGSGPGPYDDQTEHYLCPFDVAEGDQPGVPEQRVRLDEVLAQVGDRLHYLYDYGDGWHLIIKLEAIIARRGTAPQAVCTAGRRPAPHEDCGGVHAYELIDAATDPTNPDHAKAVLEHARLFGEQIHPASHRPTPFNPDAINTTLAQLATHAR
jgi:hypothetical protein